LINKTTLRYVKRTRQKEGRQEEAIENPERTSRRKASEERREDVIFKKPGRSAGLFLPHPLPFSGAEKGDCRLKFLHASIEHFTSPVLWTLPQSTEDFTVIVYLCGEFLLKTIKKRDSALC
jgi:hypothetical protein